MRILVIEDDRFYAQQITELLGDNGFDVESARSAEEALACGLDDIDGALVDLMLPNDPDASGITPEESRGGFMSGICVARRLIQKKTTLRVAILSSAVTSPEPEAWAAEHSVPFVRKHDGRMAVLGALDRLGLLSIKRGPRAFIVHGHDERLLADVKNYLQNTLGWEPPLVLREQPSAGKTIIEKFEEHAFRVDCVFVLMTPDDRSIADGSNDEKRRSRQNVIFELGFFCGALGRRSGRILLLHRGPVELPSDIAGVVWIDVSNGIKAAGEDIRTELQGAGSAPHRA